MSGRNALITGANKSIGYETARQLGGLGYRIWLGSRDAGRGRAAAERLVAEGHDVQVLAIDVTREDSVQAAAAAVRQADGKLDVLINNAGIVNAGIVGERPTGSSPAAPTEETVDAIRDVYETNVFGAIRVTQAFLPLLKAAGEARIVMVSSGLGSLGWLSDPDNEFYRVNLLGYNSSKSALNAVTVSFAKALAAAGIKVNAADPGYTATDLNGHSGYRTVAQAAAGIVWLAGLDSSGPTGGFYFERERVPW